MQTTSIGNRAESRVAEYLKNENFEILDKNWRTKVCEIDIVAKKDDVVYFVEVKYRSQQDQGDGFDYITTRKLRSMKFAARVWNQHNNWEGDWRLMAAAVSDEDIEIIEID